MSVWRALGRVVLGLLFLLAASVGAAGGLLVAYYRDLPGIKALAQYRPETITRIYSRAHRLIAELYRERRIPVSLSRVPRRLIQATLAVEDTRFYQHRGVSLPDIARALWEDLRAGRVVQGGSTITQQLAKVLFLTPERSLARKVKEALLAILIERRYTKDEILELYFNQIYLGSGAYGVEAAARVYFGKGVEDLNLPEAATLAALPKRPSYYSPSRNKARAVARRNLVLRRMREEGYITPQQEAETASAPMVLAPRLAQTTESAHFVEHIRRYLEDAYGGGAIYREGLHVFTTLEVDLQRVAQEALVWGLDHVNRRRGFRPPEERARRPLRAGDLVQGYVTLAKEGEVRGSFAGAEARLRPPEDVPLPQLSPGDRVLGRVASADPRGGALEVEWVPGAEGAVVALDPKSGAIRAMVGGYDFRRSQFNRATQARRQPGSAFKPLLFASAFENGFTPADIFYDSPVLIRNPATRKMWKPKNFGGKFRGPVTLRVALEKSINVVAVKLFNRVGGQRVIHYARRLGIRNPLMPYPSMALGSFEVTPLELTSAYATFAAGGLRPEPFAIRYIANNEGRVLEEHVPRVDRALRPETAYLISHLLKGVVTRGTGRAARSLDYPLAGKTGTTDEFRDAWFIGYTPSIALGVWVGMDDHSELEFRATGAAAALPIWKRVMARWLQDRPREDFPVPPGVVHVAVEPASGLLASSECKGSLIEAFVEGTAPRERCQKAPPREMLYGGG
ncbi:MAG: penicillin-binding protein 1A [Nitrospinota bacterium]